jgi:D-inositol-3-phosphate glycosyltransferase
LSRRRLLVVGHAFRPSGYARVLASLLPLLANDFETTLFAVNHYGDAPTASGALPYALRTRALMGDTTGREQLPALLRELEPDVVLLHNNGFVFQSQRPALDEYRRERPSARAVAWCPLDWLRLPRPVARALPGMDLVAFYTEAARAAALDGFAEHGFTAPPTAVVGHGVDVDRFRPLVPGDRLASRALARSRLFADRPELRDAFLVLNANQDNARKRIDLTVAGFEAMARTRPRARLHLHHARAAADGHLDDERLNLLYNASDVGVNTAAGEGFGLVSFEHAAAGAAQVVPDHGATAELWAGRALMLPAEPTRDRGAVVSADGVAEALARLHDDPALLERTAAACRDHARSDAMSWAAVAARWCEELASLAAPAASVP